MKRILALFLLLIFLMSGCTQNQDDSKKDSNPSQNSTDITSVPETEADTEEEEEDTETTVKNPTASIDGTEETDAPTTVTTESTAPAAPVSSSQRDALESALAYLRYSAFSYAGLVDQLEYEGFTYDQAVHGVNSVGL